MSFDSLSFSTPLAVIGNATAGSEIRLPEDTDNGSNYVAIKAPDTIASNLTLTLPSADGSSGQVLQTNGSGVLSFVSGGGKVLQVVTATDETTRTTSSTSFVTASNTLSVSITPSSASSKVFITMTTSVYSPADTWIGYVTMYRGATNLATNQFVFTHGTGTYHLEGCAISVLDSPNTTSATTYQVYFRVQSGSPYSMGINQGSSKGTITAFEIAG